MKQKEKGDKRVVCVARSMQRAVIHIEKYLNNNFIHTAVFNGKKNIRCKKFYDKVPAT